MRLKAYKRYETSMRVVPAWRTRDWMDDLPVGYANRCLPLRIANESGWFILNSHTFSVQWNYGGHQKSLHLEYYEGEGEGPASSHFGAGIVTFSIPYLFQTDSGYNLHVRGPANMPKDGASPLEGIVETDWSPYTFTMNWQITSKEPVMFYKDEPVCQIAPVKRGLLEGVIPEFQEFSGDTREAHQSWAKDRDAFLKALIAEDPEVKKQGWQKDYFQGRFRESEAPEHQTKLNLLEFKGSE